MIVARNESEHKLWFSQFYWTSKTNFQPPNAYSPENDNIEYTWDTTLVIPILATIMLALTVFLLILFRHSPGFVAGTIAGCLILIGTYLAICTVNENKSNLA